MYSSLVLTLTGTVPSADFRDVQFWNALSPMLVTEEGMLIAVRDVAFSKARSGMAVRPEGMVTDTRAVQVEKAPDWMDSTVSGISTLTIPLPLKQKAPMAVMPSASNIAAVTAVSVPVYLMAMPFFTSKFPAAEANDMQPKSSVSASNRPISLFMIPIPPS